MARLPLFLIAWCLLVVPAAARPDEEALTPAKAKELIPAAAGMPAEELRELATSDDPTKFRPSNGDSLTWLIIRHVPGPDAPKNPTSFRFLTEPPNPAALAGAISGPKDKDGKFRNYGSLIHPAYITDCTCKVDGDTATGTVAFKADKVYEGKAEYTARKKDGKWRIEEFRLPDLKIATALGKDGKWAKK
jgi:hypothetical protein